MSSKKILAASMAAILATSAVATFASAENTDYEWTITGEKQGEASYVDPVQLKIKTGINNSTAMSTLFGYGRDAAPTNKTDNTKNAYNKIQLGIWEAFKEFEISEFTSGKVTATLGGEAQEFSNAMIVQAVTKEGKTSYEAVETKAYLPTLKDGAKIVIGMDYDDDGTVDATGTYTAGTSKLYITGVYKDDAFKGLTSPILVYTSVSDDKAEADAWASFKALKVDDLVTATLLDATGEKYAATIYSEGKAEDADLVAITATATGDLNPKLKDVKTVGTNEAGYPVVGAANASKLGRATDPVNLEIAFEGLGDALKLKKVNTDKSKVEVELDVTVTGATFGKYVVDNYVVNGAPGLWSWGDQFFSNNGGNFSALVPTSPSGYSTQFGLVLVGCRPNTAGFNAVLPANLEEEPKAEKTKGDLFILDNGGARVDFAKLVSPAVMKNLNNGGTVTFKFNKDFSLAGWKYGNVVYWNGARTIPLASDFGYDVAGNSITFTIPAGLTYDEGSANEFKPFYLQWDFRTNVVESSGDAIFDGGAGAADYDGRIISMTFKANGAPDAPSVDGSNSGTTSGSQGGNTSNPGSTSGNPNTGIALAVAPIVLAAGAVVTIASKKRK